MRTISFYQQLIGPLKGHLTIFVIIPFGVFLLDMTSNLRGHCNFGLVFDSLIYYIAGLLMGHITLRIGAKVSLCCFESEL